MNFDLHTHVSLKTMLGGNKNKERKDCWTNVKISLLDPLSGGAINSQSSLRQLKQGNVKIAIAALYTLEHSFSENWLLSNIVTKLTKKFSAKYLKRIRSGSFSPYHNLKQELKHLENSSKGKMQIIHSLDDLDWNKINLLLCTEGMHNFLTSYKDSLSKSRRDIAKNFKEFKAKHRVLYTGMSHLTRNNVCTHSYAMKLLSGMDYIPQGSGLTSFAKEMIDEAYAMNGFNNKRTLIDIKHMNLVTRMQFYRYREQQGYQNIPIVASHFAVTGNSYNNIPIEKATYNRSNKCYEIYHQASYSDVAYKYDTSMQTETVTFNPWSLNLYNEEIIKIVESKGIIGMIMDERVLGAAGQDFGTTDPEGEEFFSKECWEDLQQGNNINSWIDNTPLPDNDVDYDDIVGSKGARHLYANIIHIVRTYYERYHNLDAWNHICIGSDNDGLIKPIEDCLGAQDFDYLRESLTEIFDAERQRAHSIYFGMWRTSDLIEKIFYLNGYDFVRANL